MTYDPNLPAGSALGKSYEYGFDVYNGDAAVGVAAADSDPLWLSVRRALNVAPNMTPVTQTAQTYDDKGSQNNDVTAWNWTLGASAYVNRSQSTGLMVPELKVIYDRMGDTKGEGAKIAVRWYHKPSDGSAPNPDESWKGTGTVAPTRGNTAPDGANELSNMTFTGTGPAVRSTYLFPGWSDDTTAPAITAITPTGQAADEQIRIDGSQFDGTTGVTIGGTPMEFTLVSGSTIIATIPTGTVAGAADVIVTTPDGASPAVSYEVA